jgi:hypothetical protein
MPPMARLGVLSLVVLSLASPVFAQPREPLPLAAADLRGFYSGFGRDSLTAQELGIEATELPARGWGWVAGAHVYPWRGRIMSLGLGAELLWARAVAQTENPASGDPIGVRVEQRLRSLSPQISLNFGHRDGWSYLTAGMGRVSLGTFLGETPPADAPPSKSTINMGGGARWFVTSHVAFEFDVRFYLTRPEVSTSSWPARQRTRLLVLSAGIGVR